MADDVQELSRLRAEVAAFKTVIERLLARNEAANHSTLLKLAELDVKTDTAMRRIESAKNPQADVIQSGGSSSTAAFSIRYRNDTATANPEGIHRLEWIAKATAYDPSTITEENPTGDMWPDADWTAVAGGDAV